MSLIIPVQFLPTAHFADTFFLPLTTSRDCPLLNACPRHALFRVAWSRIIHF